MKNKTIKQSGNQAIIKALLIIPIVAVCLLAASCNKERTCRCSVRNSSVVRIIEIDGGTCEGIRVFRYHDALDTLHVDSLLCTDHTFLIDSIYKTED